MHCIHPRDPNGTVKEIVINQLSTFSHTLYCSIEEVARVFFWLFTHPDGGAVKLIEAEVRSTRANSEKLNSANKNLSFFEL